MDMTDAKAAALRAPFPESAIGKLPKAGVTLDYVGHAAVTDRLLQVDPLWTWEPLAVDDQGLPALDAEGNLWIRLTVCGVTRLGVGDGKNAKERISDAIRNAAMRFGVALDLWSKEDLHDVRTASERNEQRGEAERVYREVAEAGRADPDTAAAMKQYAVDHDRRLTVPDLCDPEWRDRVEALLFGLAKPGEALADAIDPELPL